MKIGDRDTFEFRTSGICMGYVWYWRRYGYGIIWAWVWKGYRMGVLWYWKRKEKDRWKERINK